MTRFIGLLLEWLKVLHCYYLNTYRYDITVVKRIQRLYEVSCETF